MAIIGLDLGGTKLSGALFTHDGGLLTRKIVLLKKAKGPEVGQFIQEVIDDLIATLPEDEVPISGIGISVPGISHKQKGTVWAPNIDGWENYPLLNEITSYLDNPEIRIAIDSDRTCSILGEVWKGVAQGCNDAIFLAVGTGIGAGILSGGKIIRGADDIAGAIGWMALSKPYEQKFKGMGCFEYHASGEGLVRMTRDLLEEEENYTGILQKKNQEDITAHTVFEAYEQNDPIAVNVLHRAVEYWGMAIANLVSLLNPEKIILGGGVFGPALRFIDQIAEESAKWSQPISSQIVSIIGSELKYDAPLYGAAYLALKENPLEDTE
jgi:glucokinase